MVSTTHSALPALFVLVCCLGLHGTTAAATSGQDPSTCKRWGLNTAGGLYQFDGSDRLGITDDIGHGVDIVCPLVRTQEAGPAGMQVTLSGLPGGVLCVLYSNSYQGALLGSVAAYGGVTLTLPQSQVPPWSAQSLYCLFPVGWRYGATISGIRIDL